MAVSFPNESKLRVYRLEADCTTTLLHTVSRLLKYPGKMCILSAGTILVSDCANDCVQELNGPGEAEPQQVRSIPIKFAWSIALHGDTLAIGTRAASIKLLSYASGAVTHSFGSRGSGPGQIGGCCASLRFTPDGQYIVAAEYYNKRMSMFRVSDGKLREAYRCWCGC
jgi:hypothetical protein